jgi:hypothetical protein
MANKLDPRVNSDRDTRAQYAPDTTTTASDNTHTGVNTSSSHGGAKGPHSSSILNKLDPRVDSKTGNMTTKSSHQTGTGTESTGYQDSTYGSGGVGHAPTAPSGSANYTGQTHATHIGENVGTGVKGAAAEVHASPTQTRYM